MNFKNFVEKKLFATILADDVITHDVIFHFFAKFYISISSEVQIIKLHMTPLQKAKM